MSSVITYTDNFSNFTAAYQHLLTYGLHYRRVNKFCAKIQSSIDADCAAPPPSNLAKPCVASMSHCIYDQAVRDSSIVKL